MQIPHIGGLMLLCAITAGCVEKSVAPVAAVQEPLFYANTCVEQEGGDVAGYVVIIQGGAAQPSISLSWSEGSLKGPAAATVTDYDPTSGRLAFLVHIEYGDFHFSGKIESDRLEGTISSPWEAGSKRLQLKVRPRQNAYEPTAKCR
jgi:hypothetical protein